MSEISADQAHLFVHDVLLGMLRNEGRITRTVIAAVPNTRLDDRPDSFAMTANDLLRHIASADLLFLRTVIDGVFAPGSVKIPDGVDSPEAVAGWYAEEHARSLEAIGALSGEQLIRRVDFRGMFERPAFFFLQIGLSHTIHHRGQLSTYLRPMGGKVPAVYGESYDSKEARKAAQPGA